MANFTDEKRKKRGTTKYKKHRADKGFIEFLVPNILSARLTITYSECPTIFYTGPLWPMRKDSWVSNQRQTEWSIK